MFPFTLDWYIMNKRNVETRLLLFKAYTRGDDCFCSNISLHSVRNLDFTTFRRGILTCFQISLHSAAINQGRTEKNPLQPINNSVIYFEIWNVGKYNESTNIKQLIWYFSYWKSTFIFIYLLLKFKWYQQDFLSPDTKYKPSHKMHPWRTKENFPLQAPHFITASELYSFITFFPTLICEIRRHFHSSFNSFLLL